MRDGVRQSQATNQTAYTRDTSAGRRHYSSAASRWQSVGGAPAAVAPLSPTKRKSGYSSQVRIINPKEKRLPAPREGMKVRNG